MPRPTSWLGWRKQQIICGRISGFKWCCVLWFAFVWSPAYNWLARRRGWWTDEQLNSLDRQWWVKLLRGNQHCGWVPCPSCRLFGLYGWRDKPNCDEANICKCVFKRGFSAKTIKAA